ncbi:MAG TPA: pyridoxamine 5'-phosphate oxidase [Gammaproteobacteria bacterium]|nr:pyridoxamine 5'-phosphate oxidase [Gammaproteobacteria bacterium]
MQSEELRKQWMSRGLIRETLNPNPVKQFEYWYAEVIDSGIPEPNAMSLATADTNGQPWLRTVLLKLYDDAGFVFFTNYESAKAQQIAANNRVGLLFPWVALGRQVKISGTAEKIPATESIKYFASRPRGSQIGAWASPQSQVISSRSLLDAKIDEVKHRFARGDVPLPSFWGGYRVTPFEIEFWQARDSRLHDRFVYTENAGEWAIERRAP